ncbi:hypothetical protein [Halomarina ordinaria]|uniref:Uncharacterized protein n=1 Tax=Halomarina ordinaria TaxID=3033939 RepID=A0ABD5UA12_9EURY|nr:hypothetical protein [Halomarina sp. PSRA2]
MKRVLAVAFAFMLVLSSSVAMAGVLGNQNQQAVGNGALDDVLDDDERESLEDVAANVNVVACLDAEADLAEVTVTNTNDFGVTLAYVDGDGDVETVEIDANSDATVDVPEGEDVTMYALPGVDLPSIGAELLAQLDVTVGDIVPGELDECDSDDGDSDDGELEAPNLVPVCTNDDGEAEFRVDNPNDESVNVSYDVYGGDQAGDLTVDADSEETFTVDAPDGESVTVRLFVDGEQVDVKASNTGDCDDDSDDGDAVDADDLGLVAICTDSEDDLAQFRVDNANDVAVDVEYQLAGSSEKTELTADANDQTYFTVPENQDGPTTVKLLYEGEEIDVKASNPNDCDLGEPNVDTEDIELTAICTDSEDDLAKFRVSNANDAAVDVSYSVYGGDESGDLTVDADSEEYFTVDTSDDGSATVTLEYEGEQVDVKASNTEEDCDLGEPNVDTEDITLTAICTDGEDGLAQFRVTNDNAAPVDVSYSLYGTDEGGELTVDGESQEFFTVPANDDGPTTVTLDYEGEQVDVKSSNPDHCDLGEPNDGDADDGDSDDGDDHDSDDGDSDDSDDHDSDDGDAGDGDDHDSDDGDSDDDANNGDDGAEQPMDAYQVDLAYGEAIEDLGESDDAFYGTQGRLISAASMTEDGDLTRTFRTAHGDDTRTVDHGECAVSYGAYHYDADSGVLTVDVVADEECEDVTLTLAGYELPAGTEEFDRDRADEQELADHNTVTLDGGEHTTLEIDLDG